MRSMTILEHPIFMQSSSIPEKCNHTFTEKYSWSWGAIHYKISCLKVKHPVIVSEAKESSLYLKQLLWTQIFDLEITNVALCYTQALWTLCGIIDKWNSRNIWISHDQQILPDQRLSQWVYNNHDLHKLHVELCCVNMWLDWEQGPIVALSWW